MFELTKMTIEEMFHTTGRQMFDRKSAKIDAKALSTPIIAFANADGGLIAVLFRYLPKLLIA